MQFKVVNWTTKSTYSASALWLVYLPTANSLQHHFCDSVVWGVSFMQHFVPEGFFNPVPPIPNLLLLLFFFQWYLFHCDRCLFPLSQVLMAGLGGCISHRGTKAHSPDIGGWDSTRRQIKRGGRRNSLGVKFGCQRLHALRTWIFLSILQIDFFSFLFCIRLLSFTIFENARCQCHYLSCKSVLFASFCC